MSERMFHVFYEVRKMKMPTVFQGPDGKWYWPNIRLSKFGGPGSGPHQGQETDPQGKSGEAHKLSMKTKDAIVTRLSGEAVAHASSGRHKEAADSHEKAANEHRQLAKESSSEKKLDQHFDAADAHDVAAKVHRSIQ